MILESNKLAKDVYVYVDDMDVKFSDNYFDLFDNEMKELKVLNGIRLLSIEGKVKVVSLYDSY